jgi:hypothetical protein
VNDLELARAIYDHQRRAALRGKRVKGSRIPTFDELDRNARAKRVLQARQLRLAYDTISKPREVRLTQ